ncbi:DMT family transporter [Aminobacter sp. AP02]|uniref:DMT family transporter n=1 Tax=Aminobacter sp. AP02 TaxID=2135737 RepID=UPI000D6AD730|nr:DMT family transporter [Aminobacter sp. AP02]PWK69741.1 EamA-like transporter family protein [Aminobacter sp. AP02]
MTAATQPLDRRDSIDTAAVGLMLLLTFSWGMNGVAAKLATGGFNPIFLNVARSGIGCLVVFLWCLYRGIPLFNKDGTLWGGILAGLLFGSEFILVFIALEYTTVARNSLLVSTMPFWILVGAHFWLGERMSVQKFCGLVLAFCGVVVIFSDKLGGEMSSTLLGDILSLIAGLLWALTTLAIKKTRLATAGAEKVLLYQLVVSSLMAIPLVPLAGPALREVTPVAMGALLFQSVYVVAFTYILWFWLMRRYPAAALSSFAFLAPAFSVICGWLVLGQPLTWKIFLALGLIAAGLVVVNRPQRIRAGVTE